MALFFTSRAGNCPTPIPAPTTWEFQAGARQRRLVVAHGAASDGVASVRLASARAVLLHRGDRETFWGVTTPLGVEATVRAGGRLRTAATDVDGVTVMRSSSGGDDGAIVVIGGDASEVGVILSGYAGRSGFGVAWWTGADWRWEPMAEIKARLAV